jgi:hypothetical protein
VSSRVPVVSLLVSLAALAALTLGASGTIASPIAAPPGLFWSNVPTSQTASIGRANLDGSSANSSLVDLASPASNFADGLAVDGQHLYWAENSSIGRANLDGTSVDRAFITGGFATPEGVAVDGQHIYWANNGWSSTGSIGRANLDGSGVDQNFIPVAGYPVGVTVAGGYLYWTNENYAASGVGAIGRASLDGSGVDQNFIPSAATPFGLAVDGQHVYWLTSFTLARANVDGSGVDENFVVVQASATSGTPSVAVDGQYVYWANQHTIARANLDGSGVNENFLTGTAAYGLAVLNVPGAPTGVSAVAGDGQATIGFTAPAAGGAPISGYTVTASPGGLTGTGSASPITVTGLTNDTRYTFTVTATNAVGPGAASTKSNRVTPVVLGILVGAVGPFKVGTPYTVTAWAKNAAGKVLLNYAGAATVTDLAGGSATGSFSHGKLTVQLTPTTPTTGDQVTVSTGGIAGQSRGFTVRS